MNGEKRQPPGYCYETIEYDIFQVIYVTAGRLYFFHDGRESSLRPGHAVVLAPGSAFRLSCRDHGYEGVYYIAAGDSPEAAWGMAKAVGPDAALQQLASLLKREVTTYSGSAPKLRESLAESMALQALRLAGTSCPPPADQEHYLRYWSKLATDAIANGLYSRRTPAEILSGLPLSYRQIARYLRQATGCSPKQYQNMIRENEARRLLADTSLSITSIAYELGFCSSQHFALWFRSRTGIAPGNFRQQSI